MPSPVRPVTPSPLSINEALDSSAPLARLRESLRDSKARFEAIRSAIPAPLRAHVRPGPVDADGWSLLAPNPSVGAKLRQLTPRFEALLVDSGWAPARVRVKVVS
jgi:hypothetical protein